MLRYWLFLLACVQTLFSFGLSDSTKEKAIKPFVSRVSQCLKDVPISVAAYSLRDGQYSYYDTVNQKSSSKFCIGGATQAFTAILLAKLLEGNENVTWDTPIQRILGRRLGSQDRYIDENLNLKDILSMRSGLAGMNIVPIAKPFKDLDETLRHIRFAPQVKSFRDSFVYNEVLFAYVEEVLQHLGNDTWANLVKRHILDPLGMLDTVFITDAEKLSDKDWISGTVYYQGGVHQINSKSYIGFGLVAPAAALCTTSQDMLIWLRFLFDTRSVVSKKTFEMTLKSMVPRNEPNENLLKEDVDNRYAQIENDYSYTRDHNALGWIKGQYRGFTFISQDGSLPGYQTLSTIIPSMKVAVYTSFPGDESYTSYLYKVFINQHILDILLGIDRPWLRQSIANLCTMVNELSKKVSPVKTPGLRSARVKENQLEDYEGEYHNYAYGRIKVTRNETRDPEKNKKGKTLYLTYGMVTYEMISSGDNQTFRVSSYIPYGGVYMSYAGRDVYMSYAGRDVYMSYAGRDVYMSYAGGGVHVIYWQRSVKRDARVAISSVKRDACVAISSVKRDACVAINSEKRDACVAISSVKRDTCVAISSVKRDACVAISSEKRDACVANSSEKRDACVAISSEKRDACVANSSEKRGACVAISSEKRDACVAISSEKRDACVSQYLFASDSYYWYSTSADFYREHRKIFAVFDLDATDEDGESAKSVTIQGFDKNIDVLFSTNSKPPKIAGWYCNAAGHTFISTWLLILGIGIVTWKIKKKKKGNSFFKQLFLFNMVHNYYGIWYTIIMEKASISYFNTQDCSIF
ncbi:hypothetical protein Btru_063854 [Bulinus truncatus]|nr:hypothetical protein Btru_063854 [Bulinus truncatus]